MIQSDNDFDYFLHNDVLGQMSPDHKSQWNSAMYPRFNDKRLITSIWNAHLALQHLNAFVYIMY